MADEPEEEKRRLLLFLGAGASVRANVPHTIRMLELFRESISSDKACKDALEQVERALKPWVQVEPKSRQLDTESVLEAISFLIGPREAGSAFVGSVDDRDFPSREALQDLRTRFLEFIREKCLVSTAETAPYDGFRHFFFDYQEIRVFTVNYDLVIEQLVSRFNLGFVDGFRLHWDPRVFDEQTAFRPKVCIYKLHGSAIWFRSPNQGHLSMPIKSRDVILIDGTPAVPLMMYPAQKWEYERPFFEILGMFSRTLEDSSSDWMVVVGYSFRDEHLNRVFRDAFSRNPFLKMVLISPHAEQLYTNTLTAPAFGWKIEPGSTRSVLPESPLSGRVVRIPFAYEQVLDDFAREGFASVRQAFALYQDARQEAEKNRNQNWSYIGTRLVEEGFVDFLDDVESRVKETVSPDTWRVGYYATKAAVLRALGEGGADAAERLANEILLDWFGPALSLAWEKPGDFFGIGVMADSMQQPNSLQKARNGLMNIPGYIDRFSQIVERYSRYLDGDDRQPWFVASLDRINRIRDYCRIFQSNVSMSNYIEMRRARFVSETQKLSELREELRSVKIRLLPDDSDRKTTEIAQDMLDIISAVERVYLRESVLALP